MSIRRERHQRGLRGPLARPNAYTSTPAPVRRRASAADFFMIAVADSLSQVGSHCPEALDRVEIGVEEVPQVGEGWSGDRVPLAAAVEASADRPARIVVYRRPLEHRAASRKGLRVLVHRTIVEQVSALTGRSIDDLDPEGHTSDDWDE